jgi:hypothetical protein
MRDVNRIYCSSVPTVSASDLLVTSLSSLPGAVNLLTVYGSHWPVWAPSSVGLIGYAYPLFTGSISPPSPRTVQNQQRSHRGAPVA